VDNAQHDARHRWLAGRHHRGDEDRQLGPDQGADRPDGSQQRRSGSDRDARLDADHFVSVTAATPITGGTALDAFDVETIIERSIAL
jgi:hypothetical protein